MTKKEERVPFWEIYTELLYCHLIKCPKAEHDLLVLDEEGLVSGEAAKIAFIFCQKHQSDLLALARNLELGENKFGQIVFIKVMVMRFGDILDNQEQDKQVLRSSLIETCQKMQEVCLIAQETCLGLVAVRLREELRV